MSDKGPLRIPSRAQAVGVVGLGPAGRAVAAACAAAGLAVTALDPRPDRPWRATYGGWQDEFPVGVPMAATVEGPLAWTTHRQGISRAYSVLDTRAFQRSLDLSAVNIRTGRLGADAHLLDDDFPLDAAVIIDARGASAAGRTQQTAYGVVVSRGRAECVLDGAQAWFMDWRSDNGAAPDASPSFLYGVPLGPDRVLLEETSLARRPGLGHGELARRLHTRLRARGLRLDGDEPVERVRFALDTPLPHREWAGRAPGVVRFGAAAPLLHPASGYSVAAALQLAPQIAGLLAGGGQTQDLQHLIWSREVRAVHALRLRGLHVLLRLAPEEIPKFFAAFFATPTHHQRAYLSGRDDFAGTAAAMRAVVSQLPVPLRARVIRAALFGRAAPVV